MSTTRRVVMLIVAGAGLAMSVSSAAADLGSGQALCKDGGWMVLTAADGTSFRNQGACVSYAVQGGRFGQTVRFTSSNPSPVVAAGASYTPAATASSGLAVAITLDSSSTGCSLSGGVVSFPASGTCVIDANQGGNGAWAPAPQVQQTITIIPAVPASLVFDAGLVPIVPGVYDWGVSLVGHGLMPGATVYVCEPEPRGCVVGAAPSYGPDANGDLNVPGPIFACSGPTFPLYWKTTAADGQTITSNVVNSSPCP